MALTAYAFWIVSLDRWKRNSGAYVEALNNEDGQVHNALSLAESINLLSRGNDTTAIGDEIGTVFEEIDCEG